MGRQDILTTRYGEMISMINCEAISNGLATQKRQKKTWTYDEVMALR